jgi:DNA-binding XRE family transcriptional regulator
MTVIKNERQYRITKAQAERFAAALSALASAPEEVKGEEVKGEKGATSIHPLLRQAEREALESQLGDLRGQMAEYEALASGVQHTFVSDGIEGLAASLIRARIASGLSQRELAVRLGLKEQQVQRYEATEYSSASLSRVREVVRALGATVREEVSLTH